MHSCTTVQAASEKHGGGVRFRTGNAQKSSRNYIEGGKNETENEENRLCKISSILITERERKYRDCCLINPSPFSPILDRIILPSI